MIRYASIAALTAALALAPAASLADTAAAAASAQPLVLVPYEEPGSKDPHAATISQTLQEQFGAAGLTVKAIAPIDHLSAVASAAKICADNNVTGILIPEARYEQTKKVIPTPFVTVLRYPTHAEFRLDQIGCDGSVRWTTTAVGDQAPAGAFSVGNLGAAVDAALKTAEQTAVAARAAASVAAPPAAAPVAAVPVPATVSSYLLVPFEQPGIADPHASDLTNSLQTKLKEHKLDVKTGAPVDHLSVVSTASQLCTSSGAQAIIVPGVRIEQSSVTGRSHAAMRLTLMSCGGTIVRESTAEADMGQAFMYNFGAAVVNVSEQAMSPAIDQLFPASK
ncbi:MAG: hypothetical protein JOY59_04250 [Candidatus Eremiobacteraeota bacterium]|nr:hypothetical protein [Candidatus Eremiobacteraeota bacterium]